MTLPDGITHTSRQIKNVEWKRKYYVHCWILGEYGAAVPKGWKDKTITAPAQPLPAELTAGLKTPAGCRLCFTIVCADSESSFVPNAKYVFYCGDCYKTYFAERILQT